MDKAIAIWSHIKTCKQQEQQLKKMRLDNELMADMINTYQKITSNLEKNAIRELTADACSPEEETRMKMCIEKLVSLFDKGLEIHAAIEQKDVKPIFPVAEQWKQLQEKSIGLLEDMSNGDGE